MASLVTGANPGSLLDGHAIPRGNGYDVLASSSSSNAPTAADFASIWGPAAMDLNLDKDRNRRTSRMHLSQLPQELQGQQIYIADRIDGLITTSTGSPFTSIILPYVHWDRPDNKIAWRVFSFDEGLASRVPYESAARTLTESREQFSTYATRHGLAITMEHNFMMSEEGRTNLYHRVQQVVGSIQKTNDLHVHRALIKCGSNFRKIREKYYRDPHSMEDEIREYVNMFGMVQKNVNAIDILIEDGKQLLRGWGASEPNFLLLNSRLTFALQMNPERTQYLTQGPDGQKRLKEGPDVKAYRGIRIIHSRAFPIEEGSAPRDLLRRRVRVGEFYVIPNCSSSISAGGAEDAGDLVINTGLARGAAGAAAAAGSGASVTEARGDVKLYDESSDSFVVISYQKLLEQCRRFTARSNNMSRHRSREDPLQQVVIPDEVGAVLLLRPNIEHWMLGIIMGKGGSIDDLGATLWGQTELSCADDGTHGVWSMAYKYHASAVVFNERNLIRMWDISYDGYVGGKDASILDWGSDADIARFIRADNNLSMPYGGPSIVVLPIPTKVHTLPSPLPIANLVNRTLSSNAHALATADLFVEDMSAFLNRTAEKTGSEHIDGIQNAISAAYDMLHLHRNSAASKCAGLASMENEATLVRLAYGGTYSYKLSTEANWNDISGAVAAVAASFNCRTLQQL